MTSENAHQGGAIEAWRATAFTIAGVIFAADAAILAFNLAAGTQEQYMTVGQAFIGAAWTASFIGLLGFHRDLADRNRWLVRLGGIFAVIGLITNLIMAVVSISLSAGVIGGTLGDYTPYFLPGMFPGIVLGCGLYGIAALRTSTYTRDMGLLFLLLVLTFLFNLGTGIAGFNPVSKILAVVAVLTFTNLVLGYKLRTGSAVTTQAEIDPRDSTP
ncbi:hypothetical protein [Natrinema halophilum]|uniref:Uncharacterized protein n=1 Tax=Natrinema halophilum TaxID=1699371 RepID=A0A7D5GT40_9EURY|nr:hypothetical protein [Natrinema halophilum]QLG49789.1 hypothetical protein HYG82_13425 [Natrinema halophilum]